MELYEIKELIIELENEIKYFEDCLEAYKRSFPQPPVAIEWKNKIKENNERIKELNILLFDSIQKPNGIGRPSLGVTKKVSITLPEEYWDKLEVAKSMIGTSKNSEILRKIIVTALD